MGLIREHMKETERMKEMAAAIAMGMIIYERVKRSIPLEETPSKDLVLAHCSELFNEEKNTPQNTELTILISEEEYNMQFYDKIDEIVEIYAKGQIREGAFRSEIESLINECFKVSRTTSEL